MILSRLFWRQQAREHELELAPVQVAMLTLDTELVSLFQDQLCGLHMTGLSPVATMPSVSL